MFALSIRLFVESVKCKMWRVEYNAIQDIGIALCTIMWYNLGNAKQEVLDMGIFSGGQEEKAIAVYEEIKGYLKPKNGKLHILMGK